MSIAWFNAPNHSFTPYFFIFDQRGQECLHIYLWILKDLAWMQALGHNHHHLSLSTSSLLSLLLKVVGIIVGNYYNNIHSYLYHYYHYIN